MAVKSEFAFLDEPLPTRQGKGAIIGDIRQRSQRFRELLRPGPERFKNILARTRGTLTPLFRSALLPGLTAGLERETAARGGAIPISEDFGGAIENLGLTRSFDVAGELAGLRDVAGQVERGAQEIRGPTSGEERSAVLGGAASGLAAGGPAGAITGAVGGYLSSRSERRAARRERQNREQRARAIAEETAPEKIGETFGELRGVTREAALASGAGARREQQIQSAISLSGLRGTGLGSLAAIAGGVQEELGAIDLGLDKTLETTTAKVGEIAGAPLQRPRTGDRLAQAIEGMAQGFLAFKGSGTAGFKMPSEAGKAATSGSAVPS